MASIDYIQQDVIQAGEAYRPIVYWSLQWKPGQTVWTLRLTKEQGYRFTSGGWTVTIKVGSVQRSVYVTPPYNNYDLHTSSFSVDMGTLPNGTANISFGTSGSYTYSGIVTEKVVGTYYPPQSTQPSRINCTSSASLGDYIPVYITADSTSYTHTLSYSFDGIDWTDFSTGTHASTAGVSYIVSLNTSLLSQYFTEQVQRSITIRCITYNGSTPIGDQTTVNCTITAPSSAPDVTISCSPYNMNPTVSGWGIYLQTYSQINITVNYSLSSGSTFGSCKIVVDGTEIQNSAGSGATRTARSGIVTVAGNKTISATVTDSRGASTTQTYTVFVYPYTRPYASDRDAIRYSSNVNIADKTGTNISAKATMGYSSIGGRNSAGILVRYKESGETLWSSATSLTSGNANHVKINGSNVLDADRSYVVQFIIYDTLHPQNADPTTVEVTIVTNSVVLHARDGGGALAVGDYCRNDNAFEVNYRFVLNNQSYGTSLPSSAVEGQVFFLIGS